jgi:hypothetical protein
MGEFLEFLKSPHEYLLNIEDSEIAKIIYIKRNSEGEPELTPMPENPIPQESREIQIYDNLESDNETIEDFNSKVEFRKGNGTIKWSNIWEFYLYHEPADDTHIQEFITSLNKSFDLNIKESLSQKDLEDILEDKEKLKKLREHYREKFKDLNKTGLVVQHKPLGYKTAQLHKFMNTWVGRHHFNPCCRMIRNGSFRSRLQSNHYDWGVTLLTGDIPLNQIDNSIYVRSHLDKVLVFQVPHHGSSTNWVYNKLNLLNNKGKTTAVICFGYGNQYGHPREKVLSDLQFDNFDIRFCTQFENFEYQIILTRL